MIERGSFYSDDINLKRVNEVLIYVIKHLNLGEILKMIRDISYDMICYYDEDNKGIIYKDKEYSIITREQACRLQRLLSAACDLFGQSIIQKREFDEKYLEKWIDGGYLQLKCEKLEEKIKELTERNEEIE